MASGAQMALVSAILLLSVAFRAATATEFMVGGDSGWATPSTANGLDYQAWADTTDFVVGDTLVFNYDPNFHNVLSVTGTAFAACNISEPLQRYRWSKEGNSKVTFEQAGRMWFMCAVPTHCSRGQAFKVSVSAASGPAAAPQPGAGNASIKASKAVMILLSLIAGICLL